MDSSSSLLELREMVFSVWEWEQGGTIHKSPPRNANGVVLRIPYHKETKLLEELQGSEAAGTELPPCRDSEWLEWAGEIIDGASEKDPPSCRDDKWLEWAEAGIIDKDGGRDI